MKLSVRFWGSALQCGENWYSIWSHKPNSVGSIPTPATTIIKIMEENTKVLYSAVSKNLREIVRFINERGIQKEDLFYLEKDKGEYTLLYFS